MKKKLFILKKTNCSSYLKQIKTESISLILTDPPYNLGLFMKNRDTNIGAMRKNHFAISGWDNLSIKKWEENMQNFFYEANRVLVKKGNLLLFMSLIKIETIVRLAEKAGLYYKTTGIWHKTNPMPRNKDLHFINSTESWVHFTSKSKTGIFNNNKKALHDFIESSNINRSERKEGIHPTQKPIKILSFFVEVLSNKNDLVLDPFMGSGSTGVAALAKKRNFIGVEINSNYFKIAKKRIKKLEKEKFIINESY
jgi:DNA modification methylase